MPTDQNSSHAFNEAKARAENQWQNAVAAAQQAFEQERAGTLAEWTEAVQQAQQAFDRVRSDAAHPDLPEAQARMEALRSSPPDHQQARDNLAAAVRTADDAFHAALAELRAKHGRVVMFPSR